ncbi:MAG: hypothetical protein SGILL_000018 [Bacillariaceae sp.]
MSSKSEKPSATASGVFSSADFLTFLSRDSSKKANSPSLFLSKDSFFNNFESKDVFKSKDSFSNLFTSKDWEMACSAPSKHKNPPSMGSNDGDGDSAPKKFVPITTRSNDEQLSAATLPALDKVSDEAPELVAMDVMKSGDWMVENTLGNHVEVPLSMQMFSKESPASSMGVCELGDQKLPPGSSPRVRTQWDELFMAQLKPLAPSPPTGQLPALTSALALATTAPAMQETTTLGGKDTRSSSGVASEAIAVSQQSFATFQAQATRKTRKRAPRKKVIPAVKEYILEPTQEDIFCGRGGRGNHHPGNKRYREEVENLKEWYNNIDDKDQKTDLSQCLVDYVKSYGARFLEKDKHGWYVIDNITARRKVSQALREDTDPEKRHAKRQRFLAKRARLQKEAAAKKQAGA